MKLSKLLLFIAVFACISIYSQETEENQQSVDSGTIENQFDYIIDKSNKYQEYKVVKRVWLDRLKKAVDDSLNIVKKELIDTKSVLAEKESEIITLKNTLETTNKDVTSLNNEKDSMNFMGVLISKQTYNTILWSIIGILLIGFILYIFRFNRSNSITTETQNKFDELETEYENHRQRSLEREQQLRRKLQDEINKQKEGK